LIKVAEHQKNLSVTFRYFICEHSQLVIAS